MILGGCDAECWLGYLASSSFIGMLGDLVIFLFLPKLATLVLHEAGHYYAAKLIGVDSAQFAIGIGPEVLRVRATPSGCDLVLKLTPFGGRVTYTDDYWQLNVTQRAFLTVSGPIAEMAAASFIVATVYLLDATGPMVTLLCYAAVLNALLGFSPLTPDGRKLIRLTLERWRQ